MMLNNYMYKSPRLFCLLVYYILLSVIQPGNFQVCYPVEMCTGDIPTLGRLIYDFPLGNLDSMGRSGACPNTLDSFVNHWQINFTRDGIVLNGDFCIEAIQFNSNRVCHKNGSTVVFLNVKDNEFNMTGQYDLQFIETGNDPVRVPIRFKPTGVYALHDSQIIFNPDDNPNFVLVTFLIYSNIDNFSLYHNDQFITNTINSFLFFETTVCFSAVPPPDIMTTVLTYYIPNPSAEAVGNYTLVAGGTYYNTVSLVLDPDYIPPPTPAPNTTSNKSTTESTVTSTSFTIPSSTLSMVSPSTSTDEVNDGNSSNISTITIIIIIVVVVVILVLIIVFIVVIIICLRIVPSTKTSKGNGGEDDNNNTGSYIPRQSVVEPPPPEVIELNMLDNQPAVADEAPLAEGGHDQGNPNPEEQTDNGNHDDVLTTQQNGIGQNINTNQFQEQMRMQTDILQQILSSTQQQVMNTERIADNTQQSVEIQSEQLEIQRGTNELLETNLIEEGPPLSSVSTPTIPPPNHTLSQPSTTSLPATNTSHTHSDTLTDHTHQDQPSHDQSISQPPHTRPVEVSGDESPDHTSPVPRPNSTATPPPPVINADTSDDLSNDEDITERGAFGEESPAPRVRPVTTEEQFRLINLKLIDIHPESKELGIALGLDETTLISSTDEGHQRNLTDRERLQKVFVKWKRMGGVRTWRVIYDALVKMKFLDVAQKIKDSHPDLDIDVPYDEDGYIQIMTDHLSAIEAHWYILALYLHLDYSTLDEIEGVHRSETHLSNVLRSWKRIKAGDANIEALFRALEDIGHRDLANELREDQEIVQAFL